MFLYCCKTSSTLVRRYCHCLRIFHNVKVKGVTYVRPPYTLATLDSSSSSSPPKLLILKKININITWRHNGRDGVLNHQPHDCLLNRLFWGRSKKTLKLHVTGHCEGNSPVTSEFPAQRASNAENVSIWWRHHERFRSASAQYHGQPIQRGKALFCSSWAGSYSVKSMLNSLLVNKDFLTWLLIGWRLCCQPIRCQVWKYLLTNMDFNLEIS